MAEGIENEAKENLILICLDNCEHSQRAFDWYLKYFFREEHTIGLVHVFNPPKVPTFANGYPVEVYDGEYQRSLDEIVKESESVTKKFHQLCAEKGITSKVFSLEKADSIGSTICTLAKENNASCVVMGQRGLGAMKRAILGSVSDYVLHHANMTVLVVPPKKHQ